MHMLLTILLAAAAAYVGFCLLLYVRQAKLVYVPSRTIAQTPADAGLPYEDVTLTTPDGQQLGAWLVPPDPATDRGWVLLNCHGNAGNIGDRVEALRGCHALGLTVFIFDYRGYGRSTGSPTEEGTYVDALTAWMYLVRTRGIAPGRILVYGHSLGGAVAAWLAEQVTPAALWLESTFTSAPDLGARMYPFLPVRRLARFRYDTWERLPRVRCPIMIAHALQDQTVPVDHSRRLFERAREPRRFFAYEGDHNAVALESDPVYREQALAWLAELERGPSA